MSRTLTVFSDLSERIDYNIPDFPLLTLTGKLYDYDKHTVACHWHPDLEFAYVIDGNMDYFVNGKVQHINTGEGIFVNSKRLHYNFSSVDSDCTYIPTVIHPSLLGEATYAGKEYFDIKFGSYTQDFILLTPEVEWQNEVLLSLKSMHEEMSGGSGNLLRLISQSASICALIVDNIQTDDERRADERSWMAVWAMTEFIHKNYEAKISLDDIAFSGSVCRSTCCQLFGKYAGQTPNTYLTRYRIHKSAEMLKESDMSVIEISMACGFQSPSYFTHVFRRETGFTPRNYRNQVSM